MTLVGLNGVYVSRFSRKKNLETKTREQERRESRDDVSTLFHRYVRCWVRQKSTEL